MAAPASEPDRLLTFAIAGRAFAVDLASIVEVIRYRPPTPVPGADPGVEGILPLRGRMVTVIDARRRLALPARETASPAQVIVVREDGELVGLVVDAVTGVAAAAGEAREPLPGALGVSRPEVYRGVLRRGAEYTLLLDLEKVLQGGAARGATRADEGPRPPSGGGA
ncbi:MAG: hypothetical protein DMF50_03305 [Acidobacteria bacterium]|nr:MAG: hypothetical protein DMF50_03305 [Acidobacteriota bacterium]